MHAARPSCTVTGPQLTRRHKCKGTKEKINSKQNDNERETNENDEINDLTFNNNHKFQNNLETDTGTYADGSSDTRCENHMRADLDLFCSLRFDLYSLCPFRLVRIIVWRSSGSRHVVCFYF